MTETFCSFPKLWETLLPIWPKIRHSNPDPNLLARWNPDHFFSTRFSVCLNFTVPVSYSLKNVWGETLSVGELLHLALESLDGPGEAVVGVLLDPCVAPASGIHRRFFYRPAAGSLQRRALFHVSFGGDFTAGHTLAPLASIYLKCRETKMIIQLKNIAVLWIRNGFTEDPDPAFFLKFDYREQKQWRSM